jgi:hypothetical protein
VGHWQIENRADVISPKGAHFRPQTHEEYDVAVGPIRALGRPNVMYVVGSIGLVASICLLIFLSGVRVVRPTGRGLVEVMVNADPQEIITTDKLDARVDAQVYFKVKSDEESVKNSQYNVFNDQYPMVNLARSTLRNIIGTLTLGRLITVERALSANTKIVVPSNTELVNIIGDMAGVLPLARPNEDPPQVRNRG